MIPTAAIKKLAKTAFFIYIYDLQEKSTLFFFILTIAIFVYIALQTLLLLFTPAKPIAMYKKRSFITKDKENILQV